MRLAGGCACGQSVHAGFEAILHSHVNKCLAACTSQAGVAMCAATFNQLSSSCDFSMPAELHHSPIITGSQSTTAFNSTQVHSGSGRDSMHAKTITNSARLQGAHR